MRQYRTCKPRRQRGAALVIGLILMMVLVMLGVSAMRGTTLQTRMSANFQHKEIAFQAADEIVRHTVQEARGLRASPPSLDNILVESINDLVAPGPTRTFNGVGTSATTTTTYLGATEAPGFSLGAGKGTFVSHQYRIDSVGTGPSPTATSTLRQGVSRIGPSAG